MGGNSELECYCNTKNIKCTNYHLLNCGGHDHFPQLLDSDTNPFANVVAEDEHLEVEGLDYDQNGNPVLGGDWQ
jgi:hypothetical protein